MKQRRVTVRLGLCVGVVFALGCSARGSGGGGPIDSDGSTKNPSDTGSASDARGGDPSVATFCGEYCTRAMSTPGCSNLDPACAAHCTDALSRALPACRPQLDALATCVRSAPIVCESPGTMTVPSCNNHAMAVTLCAVGGMNDAGSDAGSP